MSLTSRAAHCAAWLGALAALLPLAAVAQLEEIVVTTRKREESLQDLPIAVNAITEQQIQRLGITDLDDVAKLSPSVQFDNSYSPSDNRVTIRGLSNTRGRSNVAFLVDGIDVTTENLISAGSGLLANRRLLTDVERIEVVKGPQSALFGRAAFSGAISYITKEPRDEFEGSLRVNAAEDGFYQVDGAIGGPVFGDKFGLRLNGVYYNDDGHYINTVSGSQVGGSEGYGAALVGLFTPSDSLRIKGRVEYSDDEYDPRAFVRIGGGRDRKYPDWSVAAFDPSIAKTYVAPVFDSEGNLVPGTGQGNLIGKGSNPTFLGLVDHGLANLAPLAECPPEFRDAYAELGGCPGFYLPHSYGSGKKERLAQSEDPLTCDRVPRPGGGYTFENCEDFAGTTLETFRASLVAEWTVGFGVFSSYTGFTDSDESNEEDQDFQALGRPDQLIAGQQARTTSSTQQFSQELRFSSNWDSPIQVTLGGLFWKDERKLFDRNFIIDCLEFGKIGGRTGFPGPDPVAGICDGTNGTVGAPPGTLPSRFVWQEFAWQVQPQPAPSWSADTEHWSAYLAIDWTFAENWKLTLEDRWVNEDFDLLKPNQSSCTSLGFAVGQAPFVPLEREVFENGELVNDQKCLAAQVLDDPDIDPFSEPDASGPTWRYIYGSESSDFHTPKVTLEWMPTDDVLVYAYWAHAQKPGGINQLSPGGSAVTIDQERFKPEQLDAYELGSKTTWELAGFLQLNTALFFQDYTDKQIGTQILRPDEFGGLVSSPVIINAEGGQIWGLELDALWQPSFAEGLVLGLSYTYLDTEFTNFVDYSTSSSRSAFVGSCPVVWFNNQNEIIGRGPDIGPVLEANGLTDPNAVAAKCELNLTGNKFERTPENAFVGTVSYTRPLLDTGAEWFTELNASWQDERFVDPENFIRWDDYWLVDLRLGIATERVEVVAYVDNLFDDDTLRSGGSGPDFGQQVVELGFTAGLGVTQYFGALPDPRVLGVRMTYRFGAP